MIELPRGADYSAAASEGSAQTLMAKKAKNLKASEPPKFVRGAEKTLLLQGRKTEIDSTPKALRTRAGRDTRAIDESAGLR